MFGDEVKRVSEVLGDVSSLGGGLRLDEVAGRDVLILGYDELDTQWGPAVRIAIDDAGKETSVLTWSKVIIDRVKRLDGLFPVIGRFEKKGRYWTIE